MANKMTVLGVMFFDNHISPGYYFSYGTPIFYLYDIQWDNYGDLEYMLLLLTCVLL